MTRFFWIALLLLALTGGAAIVSFALYLGSGMALWQERAVRFFRWAVVIVLATFNIAIFKRIVLTIIHW